jgi:aconitate hydratase
VGGIEAVAAMLGEPIEIVTPEVIGVRLSGTLPDGDNADRSNLTLIQALRSLVSR